MAEEYVTLAELRQWIGVGDSYDDPILSAAIATAENQVDEFCGRTFTLTDTVEARWLDGTAYDGMILPYDIATTTGLLVSTDDNFDGIAETLWTINTHFTLLPANGIGPDGRSGWPYTQIRNVRSTRWFPYGANAIQITARWGWTTVPANVRQATLILAAETVKLKDAPLGVAGFGDLGLIRVRENPIVARLLSRYMHPLSAVPVA